MGSSPSKGKLSSKPGELGPHQPLLAEAPPNGPEKALVAEVPEGIVDSRPEEEEDKCLEEDEKENELPLLTEEHPTKEAAWSQLASDTTGGQSGEDVEDAEVNAMPQEILNDLVKTDEIHKSEKRKKSKGKRRSAKIQRISSVAQTKVDFPPHVVRAHQAAYGFLNPNISKYEALLDLLDQAAQTQLSLQPAMSALVFRFEEINQALEEMAEEGELMTKEHWDRVALPSGMMGAAGMPATPRTDSANPAQPPPDQLRQLLQQSMEKMRLVGGSAQALGDTTLEEAARYFSSLSNVMVEKLRAKQAAEERLTLVLARVEKAAARSSHPEDTALHSEDSGIAKRPLSAVAVTKHSSSTKCENDLMELEKSQRNLDQRIRKMAEMRGKSELAGPHYYLYRAGLRRHSVSGSSGAQKNRTNQSAGGVPALAPHPPKHQSVRRLINTFSQGVDGRPGQSLANIPPHIRRPRRSGIIRSSDTVNGNEGEGGMVNNGNNNNNSWPESKDDLDVDSLPPPPPEVLLDNSFQRIEGTSGNKERSRGESALSLPSINQKAGVSQRLKASLRNVDVLPNRAVKPRSERRPGSDPDPEVEKANSLYRQARKIIQLGNAGESLDKRDIAEFRGRRPSPLQTGVGHRGGSNDFYEGETPPYSLPVTAPPVSRVRLPPSCPSVCHRYPSPPAFGPRSGSRTSSRPSSPKTVTRETDIDTEEIVPSVSFRDARSVFCRRDSENSQAGVPPGGSAMAKPWGEAYRGRLLTKGVDGSTRRTQSEQRPGTSRSEFSKDGGSTSTPVEGSEPLTTE
ncbi:putative protein C2orf71 [Liparis tanakae]|uniref:Photoreceptor cilium actin regulator n=1 Tax=Liparis tanakae TaxID=230148 RepID=A0A4Z2FFS4_9TELE|nr:putative protein C2orf71 [Liparis tanakae]